MKKSKTLRNFIYSSFLVITVMLVIAAFSAKPEINEIGADIETPVTIVDANVDHSTPAQDAITVEEPSKVEGIMYLKEYKMSNNEVAGVICESSEYEDLEIEAALYDESSGVKSYVKVTDSGTKYYKCILYKQPPKEEVDQSSI